MYEKMRLASMASKVQGPDWRRWLSTREAALGGDRAAPARSGRRQDGKIAQGYKADIVSSTSATRMAPERPINQIVHTEDGTRS